MDFINIIVTAIPHFWQAVQNIIVTGIPDFVATYSLLIILVTGTLALGVAWYETMGGFF